MDDKKLLDKLQKWFSDAEKARSPYESSKTGWERCWNYYMGNPPKDKPRFRNNLVSPKPFEIIETWFPLVFSNPPKFTPKRVRRGTPEQAMKSKHLIQYYANIAENRVKMEDFLRSAGIYGTGVMKLYWKFSEIKTKRNIEVEDPDNPGYKKLKTINDNDVIYDYPTFDVPDIANIYVDPGAMSRGECLFVIERRIVTKDYIENMIEDGEFTMPEGKSLDDITEGWRGLDTNPWTNDRIGATNTENRDGIVLYEYWTADGGWHVTMNNEYVLREGKNPFHHGQIPFLFYRVNRPPHEFYGRGHLLPVMSSFEEINKIKSQRRDNIDLTTNAVFKVKRGSPAEMMKLIFKPGATIPVDEKDDVTQLVVNDVTQTAVQEYGLVNEEIKSGTGLNEYIQGAVVAGMQKTAGGTAAMKSAAMARPFRDTTLLELEVLQQMAEIYHSLAKQFMTDPLEIWLMDEGDFQRDLSISPDEIQCDVDFEVFSGSTSPINNEMKIQQAQLALNLMSMPNVQQGLALQGMGPNLVFFINTLLESMGVKSKEQAVVQLDENMIMQAVNMAAMQMAQGFVQQATAQNGEMPQ